MNSAFGTRIRRRDVHDSLDVFAIDQPPHSRREVVVMDPRHELTAVAGTAAKAQARETEQRVEDASGIGTQGHR